MSTVDTSVDWNTWDRVCLFVWVRQMKQQFVKKLPTFLKSKWDIWGNHVCFRVLINWITLWSRVLPRKLTSPQLVKKFSAVMEHEDSSPHSKKPATCPYPEPHRSSLCLPPPSNPTSRRFILILSSHLCLRFDSSKLITLCLWTCLVFLYVFNINFNFCDRHFVSLS